MYHTGNVEEKQRTPLFHTRRELCVLVPHEAIQVAWGERVFCLVLPTANKRIAEKNFRKIFISFHVAEYPYSLLILQLSMKNKRFPRVYLSLVLKRKL